MAWVFAPDGTPGTLPDENLERALAEGYKVREPTADEKARAQVADQPIVAGLEGLFRGATGGWGEKVIVAHAKRRGDLTDEEAQQQVRYRKEENPVASFGGEIGGTILPAVATGGGSLAAKVGLKGVAGLAVEQGLYGTGMLYSESVLEDRDLKSEHLAAGFAKNALMGGGLGVVGKGLGKGVSVGVKALGGEALATKLEGLGKEAKWLNLGGQNRKLLENEGLKDDILKLADDLKVKEFSLAEADKVAKYKGTELSKRYDDFLGKLDEKLPVVDSNFGRKNSVTLASDLTRDLKQAFKGDAHLAEELAQLENKLTLGAEEWGSWRNVHNFYKSLKGGSGTPEGFLKKRLGTELEAIAGEINPGVGAQFKKLNKDYSAATELEDAITRRATGLDAQGSAVAQGVRGATWAAGAGFLGMGAPGIVAAGLSPFAKEFAARKGGFIVGNVLESVGPIAAKAAKQLEARINTIVQVAPGVLGPFARPLLNAAARGPEALLAEHAAIAGGPGGEQYLANLGMSFETPEEVRGAGERMAILDAIERGSQAQSDAVRKAAESFIRAPAGPKSVAPKMSRGDFEERVASLEKLVRNPEAVFESLPPEFLGGAPATVGAMGAKLQEAAQFLHKKAPRSPWAGKPESLQQPWQPSEADKARWYRYVEAVEDPSVVLKRMEEGQLAKEHIEALQTLYPRIYGQLQQELSDTLMQWKKPITWDKRQALALVLGPEVYTSTQQVSTLQQVHAKNRKKDGQQQKGPDGRQQVNAEKNMATQSQRLEAR